MPTQDKQKTTQTITLQGLTGGWNSYTNPELLARFTTESGKLIPRRITGLPAWLHRVVVREIKRSRAVNLMP